MDVRTLLMAKAMGGGSLPFGEETTTVGGDTLTWDGNTEGLLAVDTYQGTFYLVSDAVPSIETVKNGFSICTVDGENITSNTVNEMNGVVLLEGFSCVVCTSDMIELGGGIIFPKKGIYFPDWLKALTIPGYTGFVTTKTVVKTIEPKYLPEHLQFGEEKAFEPIVWDCNTAGRESFDLGGQMFYKIAEYVPITTAKQIDSIVLMTAEGQQEQRAEVEASEHGFAINGGMVAGSDGQFDPGVGFAIPAGVWAPDFVASGMPFVGITISPASTVKTLDEKYMPLLTSPSGKKFKLTVDDSGTISATEVT